MRPQPVLSLLHPRRLRELQQLHQILLRGRQHPWLAWVLHQGLVLPWVWLVGQAHLLELLVLAHCQQALHQHEEAE